MKNRWLIALSAIGIHICIGSAQIRESFGLDHTPIRLYPERNDLDFFDRNFISRTVSGIFGRLR